MGVQKGMTGPRHKTKQNKQSCQQDLQHTSPLLRPRVPRGFAGVGQLYGQPESPKKQTPGLDTPLSQQANKNKHQSKRRVLSNYNQHLAFYLSRCSFHA
jgi:hypothetical protein